MKGWLESIVGPDYAAALMWTIVALIVLLVLLVLVRILRGFGVATFVSGGRNRKARLAVMDATAVDSHRRLVLVRRDDVEHLILIGGPTDVVVEQNIRLSMPARRPGAEDAPQAAAEPLRTQPAPHKAMPRKPAPPPMAQPQTMAQPQPTMQPPARPAATIARVASASVPAAAAVSAPAIAPHSPLQAQEQNAPQQPAAISQPPMQTPTAPEPVVSPVAATAPAPDFAVSMQDEKPRQSDIDQALLDELQMSLDGELSTPKAAPAPMPVKNEPDSSLDEEMSRLLNDLARNR